MFDGHHGTTFRVSPPYIQGKWKLVFETDTLIYDQLSKASAEVNSRFNSIAPNVRSDQQRDVGFIWGPCS